MAITISYDTSICGPRGVWTPNFVTLTNSVDTEYFDVDVSYNGSSKELRLYPDSSNKSYFNINKFLEDGFTDGSDVKTDPALIRWQFYVDSLNSDDSTSSVDSDNENWVINGTKTNYDNYIHNTTNKTYLSNYDKLPLFLNDQSVTNIYWNDELYTDLGVEMSNELDLYYLNGDFRDSSRGNYSYISKIEVVAYTADSSSLDLVTVQSSTNKVGVLDINPFKLKNTHGVTITDATKYLTVRDVSGNSETMRINIQEPNLRNDKYFRLTWINKNGVNSSYNFDYNYSQGLKIKKDEYNHMTSELDIIKKSFNTTVEEIYMVSSGWITEEESKILESLWVSPNVKTTMFHNKAKYYNEDFINDNLIKDKYIIIDVKSVDIKRRREGLINYSFEFILTDKYYSQLF